MLYFDHCATTPPFDEVVESVSEVMKKYFGNPSSLHRVGVEAERLLRKSREVIARPLGVQPDEIVFTSGGTESNNLAVKGAAFQYQSRGRHLITTEIEHASVYEAFRQLEAFGFEVTYVKPGSDGRIRAEAVAESIREDTILVSVMHVNNEMGAIQPIQEIGELLSKHPRILFHVDAVQSVGKIPVHPRLWGIDLLSASAHKLRGPKGAGFLYCRHGVRLHPLFAGGGQEAGFRSGTENVPGIVGMSKAVRMSLERQPSAEAHMRGLRRRLLTHIKDIPRLVYNGSESERDMAPHIVHVSAPGLRSEVLVHALEQRGIFVSTKSACSSGEHRPSRVLLAMGLDGERAGSGVRISLSAEHTLEDIDLLGKHLKEVVEELERLP